MFISSSCSQTLITKDHLKLKNLFLRLLEKQKKGSIDPFFVLLKAA